MYYRTNVIDASTKRYLLYMIYIYIYIYNYGNIRVSLMYVFSQQNHGPVDNTGRCFDLNFLCALEIPLRLIEEMMVFSLNGFLLSPKFPSPRQTSKM